MRRLVTDPSGSITLEDVADGYVDAPVDRSGGIAARVAAYVALTKPRIIELLLITTLPAMIVAEGGIPNGWLMLWTLVGGTLSAGGANAINCYIDRDIDEIMPRTRKRPLPMHKVAPFDALIFGTVLGIAGFALLWGTVNLTAALLSTSALLFYVFVYTLWLKRTTPQNIVIGGAAGAVPALVGWAAVTGTVDMTAIVMFGIVFYWTPPHFWALALRYEKEYGAAGVPMMPVVYGREETAKHILLYSLLLFAISLALFSVGRMGVIYLTSTMVLNTVFVAYAYKLYRRTEPRIAWGLFKYSIYYLALLFTAMAIDALISF